MDTRTRTASPSADDVNAKQASPPPVQDKISAYYSLVFPNFTFYIQTLSITIGRRCAPNTAGTSTTEYPQVDVDLGALKSVSRLHAKIEYDQEEDRFVLVVIGRNGAWVDGVWSGAGTRAPLGERSQVQIASRLFHFVLPPPPPPEDTPSPSSQSSANRQRSPSVDITSISPPSSQPSHSPPPPEVKLPPPSAEPRVIPKQKPKAARPLAQPELPNSNSIGKSSKPNTKKRKKGDVEPTLIVERPKPEDMPPKPPFTYAQMIYRSIKDMGGKATLQEICNWISTKHEYYRYADAAWLSSVRHNLSSSRAFLKGERCGGERGKGFFWSVDEKFAQTLEEQELKAQQSAAAAAQGISLVPEPKGRKKDKGTPLDPPLKRSVKGDSKGAPLPPPLTTSPLAFRTLAPPAGSSNASSTPQTTFSSTPAATGVFAYASQQQHSAASGSNPHASLAQSNWSTTSSTPTPAIPAATPVPSPPLPNQPPTNQSGVPEVIIPIILGPIPESHPDYAPGHPNNSAKEGYMVLHERKLILDPNVFSGLTKEMLEQLEQMGAPTALGVLTNHMIRALKEKRARERGKERGVKRGKKKPIGGGVSGGTPFTKVPLDEAKKAAAATSEKVDLPVDGHEATVQTPISSLSVEVSITSAPPADPGSPLIVVDGDSDDEGPVPKKRKVDGGAALAIASG
ncbi:fork head domain-containing protein [Crepidotus variabilis]|uniref:Fork head domain-containing protein n=1 Tax=Crepidotus variabilis TaxID=179855 RepID=A0A9P6ET73_9AGAR|nr:fork head domain-containing protein [Crepidotus variabilis]